MANLLKFQVATMGVEIDLAKAHLMRVHGDLSAVYTWVNDERSIVLIPTLRPGAPWYIVPESAAWTWDDNDSSNVPVLARKALHACEVLGIEPTPTNARRIAGIIVEGIPDLIGMPSAPPQKYSKAAYGQHQLRADGKVMMGEDIHIAQSSGASYG
jgi:hypothetical protein